VELAPASVNRELELLSAIFSYALDLGVFVGTNPCRRVKRLDEDNERTRILFYEEEERLMAQLVDRRAHLAPIVQLALHTMLRKTELLSLRKGNLDFERGLIWASNSGGQRTKSKKSRPVPMNSLARQMLLELCRASESEYVFPNEETGSYIKDIKTAFTSACRDGKIKDLRFHDLRRTGATRLGEAGTDAFYITAILGHADVNTSQVYTIATNEGLRRAMESLTQKLRPTVTEVPTNEERLPERAAVSA
jgi:integrase